MLAEAWLTSGARPRQQGRLPSTRPKPDSGCEARRSRTPVMPPDRQVMMGDLQATAGRRLYAGRLASASWRRERQERAKQSRQQVTSR